MAIGTPVSLGTDTDPTSTGQVNITSGSSIPAGARVFIALAWRQDNTTAMTATMADTNGLTFTKDFAANSVGGGGTDPFVTELWSAPCAAGLTTGQTWQFTISGSTIWGINGHLFYVDGIATSSYTDGSATYKATSSNPGTSAWSTNTLTTTNADDLLIAIQFADGGIAPNTTTSPATEISEVTDGTNGWTSSVSYVIKSATGTYSIAGTGGNSAGFGQSEALVAYKAAAGGAVSVDVGLITETNTAQTMGKAKTKAIGLVASTETAQPIARSKSRAVGLVTETQTAQSFGKAKVKAIGLATSTEIALPITRTKSRTLGLATSTESALSIAKSKTKAVGIATETDQALPIAAPAAAGTSHDLTLKHAGT